MQISILQCQSSRDVALNLGYIESQLKLLDATNKPCLVVLPECALLFGGHESQQLEHAGSAETSALKSALAALALRYQIHMVAGTIPVLAGDGRVFSRCYLFDDKGQVRGQYDKLHLFDVDVADDTQSYRESDTFCPGDSVCVVDTPFGKLGLAICYDLRFPELFRALRLAGADLIALPSAFTKVTGEAHWQVLLQARAIENQCYLLAANQWGRHNNGSRETWGHSMIVDPWGEVVAEKPEGFGWLDYSFEPEKSQQQLEDIRKKMPVMQHNRFAPPELIEKP